MGDENQGSSEKTPPSADSSPHAAGREHSSPPPAEAEGFCRAIVDALADAVFVVDRDMRIHAVNPALRAWAGMRGIKGDLIGRDMSEAFPFLPDEARAKYRRVFETGQSVISEEEFTIDGRRYVNEMHRTPIMDGHEVIRVATIIRDITGQKKACEQLRVGEERLRAILGSLHETAIAVYSRSGEILSTWMAPELISRWNITPADTTGKTLGDIYPPDVASSCLAQIEGIFRTGQASHQEYETKLPGGRFLLESTQTPIRNASNKIIAVSAFIRDITDRRQAEEKLRASEERYRGLVESQKDLITRINTDGEYTFVNDAFCKKFGKIRAELLGTPRSRLVHDDDVLPMPEVIARLMDTSRRAAEILERVRAAEGWRWVDWESYAITDGEGRLVEIQGVGRDITDQKRAEEALRASEERYRGLVESQNDLIVRINRDGEYTFVNDAFCQKIGKTRHELLGTPYSPLVHKNDVLPPTKVVARLKDPPHRVSRVQQRVNTAEGWRWVEWEDCAIMDEKGLLVEIQGVGRDITDRKLAEKALREAHLKLINAREEERRRLAGELHDSIGQGLIALQLAVTAAVGHTPEKDAPEQVQSLATAATRCAELLRETRNIAHDLYPPTLVSLGLAAALRQLGRHHEPSVRFTFRCPDNLVDRRLSPEREIVVFRVAQEAISNAIRHGQAEKIIMDMHRDNGQLRLSIVDNGQGFDPTNTTEGMGMLTMRQRARAVGGELKVLSQPGETTLIISVPLR